MMSSFSGTDSVRSTATIRRNGNGGRPRSSIQVFEQGPMPGVPPPEVIPVVMPTPPSSRQKDARKESNANGTYKPPLVAKLSNKLSSDVQPNHRFQYNATDDYAKKGKHELIINVKLQFSYKLGFLTKNIYLYQLNFQIQFF